MHKTKFQISCAKLLKYETPFLATWLQSTIMEYSGLASSSLFFLLFLAAALSAAAPTEENGRWGPHKKPIKKLINTFGFFSRNLAPLFPFWLDCDQCFGSHGEDYCCGILTHCCQGWTNNNKRQFSVLKNRKKIGVRSKNINLWDNGFLNPRLSLSCSQPEGGQGCTNKTLLKNKKEIPTPSCGVCYISLYLFGIN